MNIGATLLVLGLAGIFLGLMAILERSLAGKKPGGWLAVLVGGIVLAAIAAGLLTK